MCHPVQDVRSGPVAVCASEMGGTFLVASVARSGSMNGAMLEFWAISLALRPLTGHAVHRDPEFKLRADLELQDTRRLPRIVVAYRWQWVPLRRRLGSHAPGIRCRLPRCSVQDAEIHARTGVGYRHRPGNSGALSAATGVERVVAGPLRGWWGLGPAERQSYSVRQHFQRFAFHAAECRCMSDILVVNS